MDSFYIKILGICGSPVIGGNTEVFLRKALEFAEAEGAKTELIRLADVEVKDCIHCNWCLFNQVENDFCAQKDGMTEIYRKIMECDGLLVATPVYIRRLSGRLANLIDRLRALELGKYYRKRYPLKDKVVASLAVSWFRHGGTDTTLLILNQSFLAWDMIVAGLGAAGFSSINGTGKFDPSNKHLILKDEFALKLAEKTVKRMVELIKMVKKSKAL
ncbi:MAG: flavodoxin family protein [Candidatus Bathyarchaeota archaeon]